MVKQIKFVLLAKSTPLNDDLRNLNLFVIPKSELLTLVMLLVKQYVALNPR